MQTTKHTGKRKLMRQCMTWLVHGLYYTLLILVIERPTCMMDCSSHTTWWCLPPKRTITLFRLSHCFYADEIMGIYMKQAETYDQYTWEIVYDERSMPSPTLRIDLGEFYDYYYGVREVNIALKTHFLFH